MRALDFLGVAFASGVLAYLLAKYGFHVSGLEPAQNWAYAGLIFTLAAKGMMRFKNKAATNG